MTTDLSYWIARTQDHFVDAMTFDLGRYLIAASGVAFLLWVFRNWAEARRIQNRRPATKDYVREISSSFRTVFFFAITGMATVLMIETGMIQTWQGDYSAWVLVLQVLAMAIWHDAYFYWMHRAMHHRRLFRTMHLHHHKSRTPSPWAAYSFSAWEGMAEAAYMPVYLLAASLAGVAYIDLAIFIYLGWMIIRNVTGHSGVEMYPAGWVDSKWLDWMITNTHHDLHHSEGNHNFGLYFTWWDRWMGTEHPRYKDEFRKVAKPIAFAPRPAEVISVAAMAGLATLAALASGLSAMGAFAA